MKKYKKSLAVICISMMLLLCVHKRATAILGVGDVVFDPTIFSQMIVDASYQVADYALQGEMLANQALDYANQLLQLEAMLTNLDPSQWPIIREIYAVVDGALYILQKAEGLAYTAKMQQQFTVLFPPFQPEEPVSGEQFTAHQLDWNMQVRRANLQAMESQAIADQIAADQETLAQTSARSDAAVGNLQVQQAGNQLDALTVAQLLRMQEMLAAQGRAQASKDMQTASELDAAQQNAARALDCFGCMEPITGVSTLPVLR